VSKRLSGAWLSVAGLNYDTPQLRKKQENIVVMLSLAAIGAVLQHTLSPAQWIGTGNWRDMGETFDF